MVISGTITNADQGTPFDRNGNTYQNIVIRDNNGLEYTGRIGSKEGYVVNAPIQVTYEMKQGNRGEYMYFHRYNPDYPQDQQGTPRRQSQQRAPLQRQQAPRQQQKAEPDWDKIADGKVLCNVICYAIQANQISCKNEAEAKLWTRIIVDRPLIGEPPVNQPSTQPSGPNPDYDPNYQPPDDQIPF